jgi:hypothetical protein
MIPNVDDQRSRALAERIRQAADELSEAQRYNIISHLQNTVFISHSSADDEFIKGTTAGLELPGSILWLIGEKFPDPFYHSAKTGAAHAYARTVGAALLSSKWVVFIWSANAEQSDYVRAEILMAAEENRNLGVYMLPDAPQFPIPGVEAVHDLQALSDLLDRWRDEAG